MEAAEAAATKEHLDAMLASALCSLAELLTNNAAKAAEGGGGGGEALAAVATECEALLGEAAAVCPGSPEPLQGLASLRKEQGKEEEALALLRQSLALWFRPTPPSDDDDAGDADAGEAAPASGSVAAANLADELGAEAAGAGGVEGSGSEDGAESGSEMDLGDFDDEDDLPSYEFRFETAKLLLELDESVETASQVRLLVLFAPKFPWKRAARLVPDRFDWRARLPVSRAASCRAVRAEMLARRRWHCRCLICTARLGKDERMYPRFRAASRPSEDTVQSMVEFLHPSPPAAHELHPPPHVHCPTDLHHAASGTRPRPHSLPAAPLPAAPSAGAGAAAGGERL